MSRFVSSLPETTYVELVRGLFRTVLPTSIMAFSFAATGLLISSHTNDRTLEALTFLGSMAAAGRLWVLLVDRGLLNGDAFNLVDAQRLERRFATSYLTFAVLFSLFSCRAFLIAEADSHVLLIGLLFGYAAGVAAGVSFRPWIGVTAMVIAVTPTMIIALGSPMAAYQTVGCLLAIFLIGGVQSVISRYRYATSSITTGILYAAMARTDLLTGLCNRLGLAECFNKLTETISSRDRIAVHCLDLDRFKLVNDRHGHPIGDLLLKAVADRLSSLLRKGDTAARIGGDEFIVLQTNLSDATEADLMGRRLVRALSEPFSIDGHILSIGASVGYALSSSNGYDLEQIIKAADKALLRAKVRRGAALRAEPWPTAATA